MSSALYKLFYIVYNTLNKGGEQMTLGDVINEYRKKNQLTMDDFAKLTNLSKAYISMLERNKNSSNGKPIIPSLPTLKKVATAINISIDELLILLDTEQPIFIPTEKEEIQNSENIKSNINTRRKIQLRPLHKQQELANSDSMIITDKEEIVLSIGERIKQRRKELNLSVDDIAKKLGKNRATIYRYESDDIENLSITILEPLAKVLQTTPADLMGWGVNGDNVSSKIKLLPIDKQQELEKITNSNFMIVTDEAELSIIKKYRTLSESSKKTVDALLDNMIELSQPAVKDEVG